MMDDDYLALLNKAKEELPETITNHERFSLPDLEVLHEGKVTVFRNFMDIADKVRRDPQHLLQFLLKELGTPGNLEGRRVVLRSKVPPTIIRERVQTYVDTYVICSECGLPDTKMLKEDRVHMLECEACGATRPINTKKSSKTEINNNLKEGDVFELYISDVGRKGDGTGKYNDYLVIVPGASKGNTVRIRVTNISAKTAFGALTADPVTR